LNIDEIHARLVKRFGDRAIAPRVVPEAGDAFVSVSPEVFHAVCLWLRDEPELAFDYLRLISGVDWTDRFGSVYHLYSYTRGHSLTLHVDLPREAPRVASVADVWPTADWHEREAYDLVGIVYEGHPELTRILLPDDWEGHPLRKDYQMPEEYHGVCNV
jgi:NADH-quinone oxidoreductase subunit C